ncbi:TrAP [Juncus maritimus associated virus]|uniref:TrAP n=1 Tax=Juncus maritimus associated virus TaxID=2093273 RepID=A0A2I8B2K4_9GEMI|nr:TrAP [Juncus maritimus associated virus]AUT11867.1 TrAP [Juncus maritimus associated virus]
MRSSYSSPPPSSVQIQIPPQKLIHKKAKAPKRRKRINCPCQCIIYRHPDCEHGFSHRGYNHCTPGQFRDMVRRTEEPNQCQHRQGLGHLPNIQQRIPGHSQVQPQPEESTGTSQMLDNIQDLDDLEELWEEIFRT